MTQKINEWSNWGQIYCLLASKILRVSFNVCSLFIFTDHAKMETSASVKRDNCRYIQMHAPSLNFRSRFGSGTNDSLSASGTIQLIQAVLNTKVDIYDFSKIWRRSWTHCTFRWSLASVSACIYVEMSLKVGSSPGLRSYLDPCSVPGCRTLVQSFDDQIEEFRR